MIVNQKIKILVGEPWDFTSPEGENIFSGTVVDKTVYNRTGDKSGPQLEDAYLIKVRVPFECKGFFVSYIVAKSRYVDDAGHFNFHYIADQYVSQFNNLDNIINKMEFIAIGSVSDQ